MQKKPRYLLFFSLFWFFTVVCGALLWAWHPNYPSIPSNLPTPATQPRFVLSTLSAPPNFLYPQIKPFVLGDQLVSLVTTAKPTTDNPTLAPFNTLVAEMLANAPSYTTDDWHRQINAYSILIRQEIARDEKIPHVFDRNQQYTVLYQATLKHERDLLGVLKNLKRTDQKTSLTLVQQRFAELQNLFPSSVILQPGHFLYFAKDIADQREFGLYDVTIGLSTSSATLKDFPAVFFHNSSVPLEKDPNDPTNLLAKNLSISSRNDTIKVVFPGADKLQQATISAETTVLPPAPLVIATKEDFISTLSPRLTVLNKSRALITLSSVNVPKFSEDSVLSNLDFGWRVQRVVSLSDYERAVTVVFLPYQFFMNFFFLLVTIATVLFAYSVLKSLAHQRQIWVDHLLMLGFWQRWFFQPLVKIGDKLAHIVFSLFRRVRLPILLLLIIVVSFHTSLLPKNSDVLFLLSLVLWFIILAGYRLQSAVGFRFAFFILLLTIVFFFTQPEFYVEDALTWLLVLLIAGVTQEALFFKREPAHLKNMRQFAEMVVRDTRISREQIAYFAKKIVIFTESFARWLDKKAKIWKKHMIQYLNIHAPFLVPIVLFVIKILEGFFSVSAATVRATIKMVVSIAIFFIKNLPYFITISLLGFETFTTPQQLHFFRSYFLFEPEKAFILYLFPYLIIVTIVLLSFIYLSSRIFMSRKIILLVAFLTLFIVTQQLVYRFTTKHLLTDPVITSIDPTNAHNVWNEIHIHGHNFGVAQYNDAKVLLDKKSVRVLGWTDDEVVFMAGPPDVKSGQVSLVNVDQKTSNSIGFTYAPQ